MHRTVLSSAAFAGGGLGEGEGVGPLEGTGGDGDDTGAGATTAVPGASPALTTGEGEGDGAGSGSCEAAPHGSRPAAKATINAKARTGPFYPSVLIGCERVSWACALRPARPWRSLGWRE